MGRFSGVMDGLYGIANWFMRLSLVNIFWFVLQLPIVIIFLSAFQHEEVGGIILYSLPAFLFIPFLFFPSTVAMFAMVRDWILKKEQVSLFKSYFSHFKDNYKTSMISGTIWSVIWLILLVDVNFFIGRNDLFVILFVIIACILFLMNVIFISIQVHYHMKIKEIFKNAYYVTIGSPLLIFSLFVLYLLIAMATRELWFFLPFFSGTISSFLAFYLFYRFSLKVKKATGNKD